MGPEDLDADERAVLIGLLAWMLRADGTVDPKEIAELDALGEEMGFEGLADAVQRVDVADADSLLDAAETKVRPQSRELFRTLLHDLSMADGHRHDHESDVLDDLTQRWARAALRDG